MPEIYVRDVEFWPRNSEEQIYTENGHLDIYAYTPADPENFFLDVNIGISWEGSDGVWRFNILVCSPKAMLADNFKEDKVFTGRHYIIMQEYDEAALRGFIESYVADLEGLPYTQQIERLCRLGYWEAEDSKWTDGSPFVTHDIIFHDKDDLPEETKE